MLGPMVPVAVDGAELATAVLGAGEPVALVPTALVADELLPLAERLQHRFRVVHHHRRGYGGSSPAPLPGSVARDAADCAGLLAALGIGSAHVLGVSYSAAVALQLAVDHPGTVRTLTLVEPPPVHGARDAAFRAANAEVRSDRQARGAAEAADRFLTRTTGPHWRELLDGTAPGSAARALADSATFFDVDVPALLGWRFDAGTAAQVRCPVLHVAGSEHGPLFEGVDALVRGWLPHAEQVTIPGAGHDVALTHPGALRDVLVPFLDRHAPG
ncbi:alpha/beta fold hydrolase [Modestobacter roseus]|uniref:3-oxoadipate enol-lactonase n=1 Tax=Modestobacter roseus TaxID=1181884 RepID=A0A562IXX1_9ACTN|nr:alpha/beta hydrolase [Modestobacter roseus]MQA32698.1 alpha/beta fold hydrolase [Modestobacter roseus]TWH75690.1 3-oxoadipate enol-lactonase [Modestobacter roseus]